MSDLDLSLALALAPARTWWRHGARAYGSGSGYGRPAGPCYVSNLAIISTSII